MRHSKWDLVLVVLSVVHAAVLVAAPSAPVIAIGLWWNSNTISHNFVHLPFFRSASLNRLYSVYLSLLLGIPQSLWRNRHLAHHGEERQLPKLNGSRNLRNSRFSSLPPHFLETSAVLVLWAAFLSLDPQFFLTVYLPGYVTGLGLCYLHGRFEHARGTISHYGLLYNLSFFNDGYHVEHHLRPGAHWTLLPGQGRPAANTSRWPAVLRWIEAFDLEFLERIALRSKLIQRFLLQTHERAFRLLLPKLGRLRTVKIIGGGLFPRTALILGKLLPEAEITIVDSSVANLDTAKGFLDGRVRCVHATYTPGEQDDSDLVVIPLAFIGDRAAAYVGRSQGATVIHDWMWARGPDGVRISTLLLKRLNLVQS